MNRIGLTIISIVITSAGVVWADAPALFCKPNGNRRLIPTCPKTAAGLPPVHYLSGFSEQSPGNTSAEAATLAWRSYDEIFRKYGGYTIWLDLFGSQCAAVDEFDPYKRPDFAKLASTVPSNPPANHPEFIFRNRLGQDDVASGAAQAACFFADGMDISVRRISGAELLTSCHQPRTTEQFVWLHELGHMYGVGHYDLRPSTLNSRTGHTDVYSCSMRQGRPFAKADREVMATIYNHYASKGLIVPGSRPSGIDIGATPFYSMSSDGIPTHEAGRTTISRSRGDTLSGVARFQLLNLRGQVTGPVRFRVLFEPMPNNYSPASHGDFFPSSSAVIANSGVELSGPRGAPGYEFWPTGNHPIAVPWSVDSRQLLSGFTYWMSIEMEPVTAIPDDDPFDNNLNFPFRILVLD